MTLKDWPNRSLKDLTIKITDGSHRSPKSVANGYKYVTSKNIRPFRLDLSDISYITEKDHNEIYSRCDVQHGDVLLTKDGAGTGAACINVLEEEFSLLSSVALIRTDPHRLDAKFLCQYFNSEFGTAHITGEMDGLAIKRLTIEKIKSFKIPTPPIETQRAISDLVGNWDSAINLLKASIETKLRFKVCLMQQLLTGKKRFPEFVQTEWTEHRLGELFSERTESNYVYLPLLSITADQGVIPRAALAKKDTSSEDKSKYLRICPGDIGYNTMRMWQGVSALSLLEGIVSPAYTILTPGPNIDGAFASFLFKLPLMVSRFYRYSQGLVSDTLNLKYSNFAQIRVLIPSMAEQQKITRVLEVCVEEISLLEQQLSLLEKQKRGLMEQLLSGKLQLSKMESAHG